MTTDQTNLRTGSVSIRWMHKIILMMQNQKLKQELERLKLCGRYKELELGPQFATVREMCKGVNRKEEDEGTDNKPAEDSIRSRDNIH